MLKIFKKMEYAIISKIAERKFNKKYGCDISIKVKKYDVKDKRGKAKSKIKTEITAYEDDCKKLIAALLIKSSQ